MLVFPEAESESKKLVIEVIMLVDFGYRILLNFVTYELNATIPIQSVLLKVFKTAVAASLAKSILSISSPINIELEISRRIIIFLVPVVAEMYQGRYLGS